jgi:hypothetical protein
LSSILALLNQIQSDEIVLPGIQRDFVWSEDRVAKLLDSIMRGYPVGIVLLWETYSDIQHRRFVRDYQPDGPQTFTDNPQHRRLKLVLDGQQRLQSLYVALYGTYDSKILHFDLLSGRESDDLSEEKFTFEFLDRSAAEQRNKVGRKVGQLTYPGDADKPVHFIPASQLFSMGAAEKKDYSGRLTDELELGKEDSLRVEVNLAQFDRCISVDENILKVSTIDENLASASPYRKSEADVLEIFVRINREGTPLSRADLIFSMLKLNWRESADAIPGFLKTVNQGNSFDLDIDFVVRSLFAVSELGARFDLDLLRRRSNVERLQSNFDACCDSIRSAVDFIQHECWCQSSALLGTSYTIVPLVYWLFRAPRHEVDKAEVADLRKGILLIGLARPFTRYGEARVGAYIRGALKPARDAQLPFPLRETIAWVRSWEIVGPFADLLRRNHPLALHLIQRRSTSRVQYSHNAPEIDHIFPRAELRKKGVPEDRVNHFANFWVLAQGKNRNKSDQHPAKYFKDVPDAELKRALIDRGLLDYRRYSTFIETRTEAMVGEIQRQIGWTGHEEKVGTGASGNGGGADWTPEDFASFWANLQPDAQRILSVVAQQPGGCSMAKVTEATGWTGLQVAGRLSSVGHALHLFKDRPYPYQWDKRARTYRLRDSRYVEWVLKLANGQKPT